MADGAMRVLGSSVGLAVTGVAGPAEQDDVPVGTVFVAVAIAGSETMTRATSGFPASATRSASSR